jgi:hypothetical protein
MDANEPIPHGVQVVAFEILLYVPVEHNVQIEIPPCIELYVPA